MLQVSFLDKVTWHRWGPSFAYWAKKLTPSRAIHMLIKRLKRFLELFFISDYDWVFFRRIILTFSKSLPRCAFKKKKNGVHKLLWLLSEKWRNSFNRWVVKTNLSRIMLQTFSKDMVCSFHRPLRSANGSAYLKSNATPLKWKGRPTWCPLSLASIIKSHVHLDIFFSIAVRNGPQW